jgi:hypothetical protein
MDTRTTTKTGDAREGASQPARRDAETGVGTRTVSLRPLLRYRGLKVGQEMRSVVSSPPRSFPTSAESK